MMNISLIINIANLYIYIIQGKNRKSASSRQDICNQVLTNFHQVNRHFKQDEQILIANVKGF